MNQPTLTKEQLEAVRLKFEQWAEREGHHIAKADHGEYFNAATAQLWTGWQASLESSHEELEWVKGELDRANETLQKAMKGHLIATVDRMEKEEQHAEMAVECSVMLTEIADLKSAVTSLTTERDALRVALEWYTNPEVYKPHPHGPAFDNRDLSFHAKAALSSNPPSESPWKPTVEESTALSLGPLAQPFTVVLKDESDVPEVSGEGPWKFDKSAGGRTAQEWLDKYLDTDNSWLLDAYHNDQVVHRCLKHCATLGKPVPFMYQFLAHNLLIAYKEWFDRGMKLSKTFPLPTPPATREGEAHE